MLLWLYFQSKEQRATQSRLAVKSTTKIQQHLPQLTERNEGAK